MVVQMYPTGCSTRRADKGWEAQGWVTESSRRWHSMLGIALMLTTLLQPMVACAGSSTGVRTAHLRTDEDLVRYRLLLRDNPVDPREASLCYAGCQSEPTPGDYLACLSECPGFEVTPGAVCAKRDVPPAAACLVVRRLKQSEEVDSGLVVLGVVGAFVLVVTAASLCASSNLQCGDYEYYAPR